jgi:predicted DCC family thiol-disulfide oxidoreductase YuxK
MTLTLVYDGGCPFCRHFALRSELKGGLPGLLIRDGRADHALRAALKGRGLDLARGAVLLEGEQAWHGAEAIAELCGRLQASDPLMALLNQLFAAPPRARRLYPLLLWARRTALQWKGLPEDPDQAGLRQA